MTAAILATRDGNAVRCYARQPSGEIRQTGQLEIDPDRLGPHELITLVADLSETLGWTNGNAEPLSAPSRAVAAPSPVALRAPPSKSRRRSRRLLGCSSSIRLGVSLV